MYVYMYAAVGRAEGGGFACRSNKIFYSGVEVPLYELLEEQGLG